MLTLYNTLTRKKEKFVPITPGHVLFYHCGPTVYWTQHIGNLRGMTMGDLVRRALEYSGFTVKHVRNYTDVGHLTSDADTGEDKMEKGVKREGLTPDEIAKKYIQQFEGDVTKIHLKKPTTAPRATKYIKEMIDLVSILLEKGYAYTTDLAVYFDVTKFSTYTNLSHQQMDKMMEGAGKADISDPRKKHQADFALWFFRAGVWTNAVQYWKSPFFSPLVHDGEGFPGWHLECSAMTKALLGETIDIHMGGVEHIPVHHTNEIAQSEAANGVPFVHYWLHNEHLLVNGKKMAKSEGTGYALSEIIDKGYDPLTLRYFFLQAHYRSKQNFTWEALEASKNALRDLREKILKLQHATPEKNYGVLASVVQKKFIDSISDDINIPQALSIVWDMMRGDATPGEKRSLISEFDTVLGLRLTSWNEESIPEKIQALGDKRKKLREEKKFTESDVIRDQILAEGYTLEDTPHGVVIRKQ
ncbi:MAG: cysteine--tRNA ligase [Candidatus Gottesmanbacteria bacterium]